MLHQKTIESIHMNFSKIKIIFRWKKNSLSHTFSLNKCTCAIIILCWLFCATFFIFYIFLTECKADTIIMPIILILGTRISKDNKRKPYFKQVCAEIKYDSIFSIHLSALARHHYKIYVAEEDFFFHTEITLMWIFFRL